MTSVFPELFLLYILYFNTKTEQTMLNAQTNSRFTFYSFILLFLGIVRRFLYEHLANLSFICLPTDKPRQILEDHV